MKRVFGVEGIVSRRDGQPYVKLFVNGEPVALLSMAQARSIASDIEWMCSRTEADAMIYKFFATKDHPEGAAIALTQQFREFRSKLDAEPVEKNEKTPSGDTQ